MDKGDKKPMKKLLLIFVIGLILYSCAAESDSYISNQAISLCRSKGGTAEVTANQYGHNVTCSVK